MITSKIQVEKEEFKNILQRLVRNDQTLINLDLTWNQIGAKEMKALIESLKVNQSLLQLNLTSNQIEAEGTEEMQALSESLKVNQNLTKLSLSENGLKDEGKL
ncbi:ynein regulatory complex subunit 5 [Anaeramoeba flamelloides]|uniref:Ynein regulatory complex subunit 5 n=1 Tax=Anaeramoeba flamelloides TaxID=1746091 RepID=A0ABQ8YZT6_9EUKA|nr:ynein regulatory complex subunit 5 [Anaeramoeba flamelloides]